MLLQVLIYHGALDIICHFPGAQEMLATTNWTGKEEFHRSERKSFWAYNEVYAGDKLCNFIATKVIHAFKMNR